MRTSTLALSLSLCLLPACWAQQDRWQAQSQGDALTRHKGESEAEALYRAGHTCMEVHERDDCAIEYFERLVASNPKSRSLVGDAMFRLVELYRRADRSTDAQLLMREFWDKGMGRPNSGALAYSMRWFPADMEVLTSIDAGRFEASALRRELEPDTVAEIFSCDPETRARIKAQHEARKDKKRKEKLAKMTPEQRAAAESGKDEGDKSSKRAQARRARYAAQPDPVFEEGGCATALALDVTDRLTWIRMTTAMNTQTPDRSAALYAIPQLDARLLAAVEAGRLQALEDGTYLIPELVHGLPKPPKSETKGDELADEAQASKDPMPDGGTSSPTVPPKPQRVRLAKVDRDQLVLAGDEVMDEVLANLEARDEMLAPALVELAQKVPKDVTFFTIMSPVAMQRAFEDLGVLAALLPRPEGMLFSAVSYSYAGMFVRIPTSNPLKAAALLSLVKTVLRSREGQGGDEEGPSASERAIAQMDLSQTSDGKALQMTTVLSSEDIDAIFKDD